MVRRALFKQALNNRFKYGFNRKQCGTVTEMFQEEPLGKQYIGEVEMRQETELKGSHRSPDGT